MKLLVTTLGIFFIGCMAATSVPAAPAIVSNETLTQAPTSIFFDSINGLSGDFITTDLKLVNIENGVAGYIIKISSNDVGIANIAKVTYPNFGLTLTRTDLPWQDAVISAVDLTTLIEGVQTEVVLATIQFQLIGDGNATISIEVDQLDDDKGEAIIATPLQSDVTVRRNQPSIPINLRDNVRIQLEKWVEEFTISTPVDSYEQGQLDLYQLMLGLDGGGRLVPGAITTEMLASVKLITQSYFDAVNYRYNSKKGVALSNISRAQMRNFFNTIITYSGDQVIKNTQRKRSQAKSGSGNGQTQYGLPNANSGTTTWGQAIGDGDGDWYDELDEGFGVGRGSGSGPDDGTTKWRSELNPSASEIQTELENIGDCICNTGHIYRTRNNKGVAAGAQLDITIYLRESGVDIASQAFVDVDEFFTTRSDTLTTIEADAIDNYNNLQIATSATQVGGGGGRRALESTHELETPDAPIAPAIDSFGHIQ